MATKRKTTKRKNKKNYIPTYILSLLFITLILAVLMYMPQQGGIINRAVTTVFCGLFGVCGYFVPIALAFGTAYMIKNKDIKKFWGKMVLGFLALVNISALVNLTTYNDINDAFYYGYSNHTGGGLLGACVSVFMENMVQKVASYIILSITLIILASFITNVSLFSEIAKFLKIASTEAKDKYSQLKQEYAEKADRRQDEYYDEEDFYYDEESKKSDVFAAANDFAKETAKKKVNKNQKKDEKKKEQVQEVIPEDNFSNGIDEIFGDLKDEPVTDKVEQPDIKEEKPKKANKITEKEQEEFNKELDKAIEKPVVEYKYPPLTLLNKPKSISGDKREEMRRTAEKLIGVLSNFGVKAKLLQVTKGPTVTRYEIQLDTGVKLAKIESLANDIALNLAVSTVLIAPVPGKAAVGVEIPNNTVTPVSVREILETDEFKNAKSKLSVTIGKDIGGNAVIGDIAKMPHILIAGATGSGKSVCINSIIVSLLYKSSPEEVKLIMIDPKVVELGVYNGIPHLLIPVVTDPKMAAGALNWAVTEMMRRYKLFESVGVRKLEMYNKLMEKEGGEKIPQLVVIIDELADLMMVAAKEVEDYVCRLAQLARAAGIHLIVATQRPSVDVITGLIKANIPSRIAFMVSSQVDSRTILGGGGAEKLLGMGDMLYHPAGERAARRVQGAFVSDAEIEKVIDYIKENSGETHYSEDLAEEIERHATGENGVTPDVEDDGDALLPEAIELAISLGKISTSMVQRRLGVGYSRAGRIIDQMEARGIISGANGSKPRDVLISHADIAIGGKEENNEE